VLEGCRPAGRTLLVTSTRHAVGHLHRYAPDGTALGPVELPELGSFVGFDAGAERALAFCQLESFTRPGALFRWTAEDGLVSWGSSSDAAELFEPDTVRRAAGALPVAGRHRDRAVPGPPRRRHARTRHRRHPERLPAASPLRRHRRGHPASPPGVSRVASTPWPGCGAAMKEGEEWHRAGRREHKQNVFDDFAAAGDYLVERGLTSRSRLALRGGSNGGLLVGAALTQHPEMARAVHCAVPLLDMVRYPQFLIARLWTDEYGDPDVAEEFGWLWAYSPYHHLQRGTCYPAVLFTAAEGDSRVDALHARKMAAALQDATLLR